MMHKSYYRVFVVWRYDRPTSRLGRPRIYKWSQLSNVKMSCLCNTSLWLWIINAVGRVPPSICSSRWWWYLGIWGPACEWKAVQSRYVSVSCSPVTCIYATCWYECPAFAPTALREELWWGVIILHFQRGFVTSGRMSNNPYYFMPERKKEAHVKGAC